MRKVERTATLFASPEDAAREELRQDQALTPEKRLRTTWELSVLAHGPPTPMRREVTWYGDPRDADADDRAHYAAMTPQERLDALADLLRRYNGWDERRLERTARFVEPGER